MATKIMEEMEEENELERLMKNLSTSGDTTMALTKLEKDLKESLARELTTKDLIRLKDIDENIIHFISYVRQTSLWYDKKLSPQEI